MRLFHYTCYHGFLGLGNGGTLKPNPQPTLRGISLIWLTDQAVPVREELGLTSVMLDCDRLAYRYVCESDAIPWSEFRRSVPFGVGILERAPARPESWFVSTMPVFAELDHSYSQVGER